MSRLKFKNSLFILFFSLLFPNLMHAEELYLKSFGHSKFLIKDDKHSILINPFKATGCALGLNDSHEIKNDFILASSRLADEGYNPSNELMFVEPGTYKYKQLILNGISVAHDRFEGRRYGMATVWVWNQNNFKIVHMGGAAGQISIKDKILINRPDVLFISIGGGFKSYNGQEAAALVNNLKPKIVIPVHFLRNKNNVDGCDFSNEDSFLNNLLGYKIKYIGNEFFLNRKIMKDNIVYIFR
tara:strand:- start:7716 stop:8441 length:726 start_codon:yes stop_codon:yes gene_type:complete